MNSLAVKFIYFQAQFKILHWQTTSYARHMAYGGIYDSLDDLIDKFVEVYQGKHGRIILDGGSDSIEFVDMKNIKIKDYLKSFESFLLLELPSNVNTDGDSDLLNIRDEMLAELNKLKYLLTLK
jgi:hypothetical protein